MSASSPAPAPLLSKHRFEALSDGVFAVVMTLLVLELKLEHLPPHASNAELGHALTGIWRDLFGYAIAFVLTSAFWLLQHRALLLTARTTLRHTWFGLGFLFFITLMPFTVSVFINAVGTGGAVSLYFANLFFAAAFLLASWHDARRQGLLAPDADPAAITQLTTRIAGMTVACLGAGIAGFFLPQFATLGFIVGLALVRALRRNASPAP